MGVASGKSFGHLGSGAPPAGKTGLESVVDRSRRRSGIATTGRYHRLPKKLEDDYQSCRKVLGSGYNGQVFLAQHKISGEKYAVKPFKLTDITQEKRRELESECEIFLAMDHPHVARLTDVYESEDQLSLVMECMTGGELFQRVIKEKRFPEKEAVDTAWQMLLALNYIHMHNVVHMDIKLENFLYEREDGAHLKLIDFGFSKIWKPSARMQHSCGTLSYVAPEVLSKSYGSKCDMWSFGVTVFIVLLGYMPFSGSDEHQIQCINHGRWTKKEHLWKKISGSAQEFLRHLLVVDPAKRLSATEALDHMWIKGRDQKFQTEHGVQRGVVDALTSFAQASSFRRATMGMMAWSLTNEERAQVRDAFLEIDTDRSGTITINELRSVMGEQFHMDDQQASVVFAALDMNHQEEIHYSEFLAAMASTQIKLHDSLIKKTFHRFDVDNSGYISGENLKHVFGEAFDDNELENMFNEADLAHDGKISYEEFFQYMTHPELDVVGRIVDAHAGKTPATPDAAAQRRVKSKTAQRSSGSQSSFFGKVEEQLERPKPLCCCLM